MPTRRESQLTSHPWLEWGGCGEGSAKSATVVEQPHPIFFPRLQRIIAGTIVEPGPSRAMYPGRGNHSERWVNRWYYTVM